MSLDLQTIAADQPKRKDYGRIEDGSYHARVVSVVDMGLQPQTDWKTQEPKDPKKTVMITFEVPSERIDIEDDEGNVVSKPRWIGKEYVLSAHEKSALTGLLNNIGKDVSKLDELLNRKALITVGSTKNGNAKIAAVAAAMKGVDVPELENEAVFFDFDEPNVEFFEALPKWQKEKIKEALNYNGFADEF